MWAQGIYLLISTFFTLPFSVVSEKNFSDIKKCFICGFGESKETWVYCRESYVVSFNVLLFA